jgi:hypothetical protein
MWRRAAERTLGHPGLVLALAIAQLLAMELTSRPFSSALAPLIDKRPAAVEMVGGDDGLMLELVDNHRDLATVVLGAAPIGWLLAVLAGWLVAGAAVRRALLGARENLPTSVAATAQVSLTIGGLGFFVRLPALLGGFAGWLVFHPEDVGGFGHAVAAGAAALAMLAAPWAIGTVVLDYARTLAVSGARPTARRAISAALRLAWLRAGRTLTIAAVSSLLFVVAVIVTHIALQLVENRGLLHFGMLIATVWLRASVSVYSLLLAGDVALDGKSQRLLT